MYAILPKARRDGFIIQPLDDELLLVVGDVTHLLNPTAAAVWRLCNGRNSIADLSRELALDEQTISYALQQLDREQLLQNEAPLNLPQLTRREFLKRATIAAAAVPVVKTMRVPSPSQATSCKPNGTCVTVLECLSCCSGDCRVSPNCGGNLMCISA
jgi:hypothetical protein